MKNVLQKIAAGALLLGLFYSVFVFIFLPFEIARKVQAESWPSRKAIVTVSYASRQRGSGRSGPYYQVEICGTYKDDGSRFCTSRVRFGGFRWGEGEQDARDAVARYPRGAEVDVYYDPADPRETVLEPKSPWTAIHVLLGTAVLFPLIPVAIWLLRRRCPAKRLPA